MESSKLLHAVIKRLGATGLSLTYTRCVYANLFIATIKVSQTGGFNCRRHRHHHYRHRISTKLSVSIIIYFYNGGATILLQNNYL